MIVKANAARPTATSRGRVACSRPFTHLARQARPQHEVVQRREAHKRRRRKHLGKQRPAEAAPGVPVVGGERHSRDAEHQQGAVADRTPALPEHPHRAPTRLSLQACDDGHTDEDERHRPADPHGGGEQMNRDEH